MAALLPLLTLIIPMAFFGFVGTVLVALFGWLLPTLATSVPALAWVGSSAVVSLLQMVILILLVVMPVASLLTWMERRQSAMMQDRLGPNRANIGPFRLFGITHFMADALKMLFKENFIPAKANKALFILAPIMAIAPVFVVFAIVPFGSGVCPGSLTQAVSDAQLAACIDSGAGTRFQVAHLDVGMLFYFAIASLAVYGATLAGWASYNKWSLLGGMRASSQMMSYEVSMGLAILGTFLLCGSLEPGAIAQYQGTNPLNWGLLTQPLGFVLFFTAAIAESKRGPFDLPEGEPEIIGYFVEYSGLQFGMFFLAEFIEVVFISAMVSTLFLGGYNVPGLHADHWDLLFFQVNNIAHALVVVIQFIAFGTKVWLLCSLQLMIRWTLPRLRPDQLMDLGWKILLPASILNILVTAAMVLWRM